MAAGHARHARRRRRPSAPRLAAIALATLALLVGGFTVAGPAIAGVPAPAGLWPNDGTAGPLQKNLELAWSPIAAATSYDVQVSDDASFAGTVLAASVPIAHYAPPTQLPRGGYVWRVRARTSDGPGPWSATAAFTRGWDRTQAPGDPALVTSAGRYPAQTGSLTLPAGQLPAFTWAPLPDASFYEVEISNLPFDTGYPPYGGTADPYRFTCYTQHTWFAPYGVVAGPGPVPGDEGNCTLGMTANAPPADGTIGTLFAGGVTYYWRVRGRDGTADTRDTPFADPALSCTGVWRTPGGQSAGSAASPTATATPTGSTSPAPADSGGAIVTIPSDPPAYLATPECSQWSTGRPFVVTPLATSTVGGAPAALTAQPTAGDPAASTVAVTGTPVLSWAAVPGTAKYRVYLSRTTDFTDSDTVIETHATSYAPVGGVADRSVPTYWTVQACGLVACGPAAPAHAFVKQAWNGVRAASTGTDGAETVLTWTTQFTAAAPGSSPVPYDDQAKAYQVQVDGVDGAFAKPLVDVTVDHLGSDPATAHLRLPTATLPDRFVWRVRALDETGGAWAWQYSSPWGQLVTPAGFGLGSPLTVRFTGPVTVPAGGMTVVDPAGHAVPVQVARLTSTDWTLTPIGSWTAGASYRLVLHGVTGLDGTPARMVPGNVRATTTVDSASPALVTTTGDSRWWPGTASSAVGGGYLKAWDDASTGARAKATTLVSGRSVQVLACRTPDSGRAQIYLDGRSVATVDLYRSYSGCGVVFSRAVPAGVHRVTVVQASSKNARARSTWLYLDAIRTS